MLARREVATMPYARLRVTGADAKPVESMVVDFVRWMVGVLKEIHYLVVRRVGVCDWS